MAPRSQPHQRPQLPLPRRQPHPSRSRRQLPSRYSPAQVRNRSPTQTPPALPKLQVCHSFHYIILPNLLTPPAPSHLTSDVPNLPSPSSYSDFIPLPSIVGSDTIIVSRPSPQPSSVPGVLPPYPTGSPVSLPSPLPTGSGVSTPSVSSTLPDFTGAAEARNVPVVAAGLLGLAAFVL